MGVQRVRTQTLTIRTDGRSDPAHWVNHPEGPGLSYLQEAVGGLIERVWLPHPYDDFTMWAHEEALMRADPVVNHTASIMAGTTIFGDVVLVREV